MVLSNGLMRVFWPSDAPGGSNPGVLIGWRNSEYDVFVIAVLQDVEVGFSPKTSHIMRLLTIISGAESKQPCKRTCSSATAPTQSIVSWKDAAMSHHRCLGR